MITDETGRLPDDGGEGQTGPLKKVNTTIHESRDELHEQAGRPRNRRSRALLLAFAVGMGLLVVLGIIIAGAIGPGGPKSTAPSEDTLAQRKILAEQEQKSRINLRNRPLDQGQAAADPAAQAQELTPEAIARMAEESQRNRAEGNLMIGQILRRAGEQQAAALDNPPAGAGPGAPLTAGERGDRSIYRGVDYGGPGAREQAAQKEKDYERERQTMFCYSKTMTQAALYDKPGEAPAPDPGPAGRPAKRGAAALPAAQDNPAPASAIDRMRERFGIPRGGAGPGNPVPARPGGPARSGGGAEVNQVVYGTNEPVKIFEGDFIDCVLQNRIVSDKEPSPAICYVTKDHFDRSGRWVVFPTGTRIIGFSQAVNYMGAARLFVKFDRMVLPDGAIVYFPESRRGCLALDQTGANGIVSKVNRHWMLQFGTALLVGVIEGLGAAAQQGIQPQSTGSYVIYQTNDNFEKILNTIMQRYSNILPTITVNAGKKVKVYLADDVEITPYGRIEDRSYALAR